MTRGRIIENQNTILMTRKRTSSSVSLLIDHEIIGEGLTAALAYIQNYRQIDRQIQMSPRKQFEINFELLHGEIKKKQRKDEEIKWVGM